MTKLKKKKSKKRTKPVFQLDELAREDVFQSFCQAVEESLSVGKLSRKNSKIKKGSVRTSSDKENSSRQVAGSPRLKPNNYLWGMSADSESAQRLRQPLNSHKQVAELGIAEVEHAFAHPDLDGAMMLLAKILAFSEQPSRFSPEPSQDFLQAIVECTSRGDVELMMEDPSTHQVLYGEIPLTLGVRLPLLDVANDLFDGARNELIAAIEELLDGDGLPNAKYLPQAGLLLACWTRCFMLCDLDNRECLDLDAQTQYEYFVRQIMRMMRKDGTLVFGADDIDLRKTIQHSISCYYDEDDQNIAKVVLTKSGKTGSTSKKNGKSKVSLNSLPEASTYSEWAEVACLRTEWLPKSPSLTVAFQDRKILAELSTESVLFSGELRTEFAIDGNLQSVTSDWEVVCWHSDQDGDFLELECDLENGAKWQKHFLLARNELFCLMGDVILSGDGQRIRVSGNWPLGPSTGFGIASETTEIFLTQNAKNCCRDFARWISRVAL